MTELWGWSVELNDSCSYLERSDVIKSWLLMKFEMGQTVKLVDPQRNPFLWPLNWVTFMRLFNLMLWVSFINYKLLLFLLLSRLFHKRVGRACLSLGAAFCRLTKSTEFWYTYTKWLLIHRTATCEIGGLPIVAGAGWEHGMAWNVKAFTKEALPRMWADRFPEGIY